jgi:hypothetical protein
MSQFDGRVDHRRRRIGRFPTILVGLLLCLAALPALAQAKPLEQTGTFGGVANAGEVSEESQINGVGGMAVNYTGNGGVPKGTVYAVTVTSEAGNSVVRFEPSGEGLKFVERWGALTEPQENTSPPYAICGPAVVTESLTGSPTCSNTTEKGASGMGIAIDQATGDVFVSQAPGTFPEGTKLIAAYTANGSQVITRFGEQGPHLATPGEHTVAETPAMIHESSASPMAANAAGEVFMFDLLQEDSFHHRIMVFAPKAPGSTEYQYTGQARDIGATGANFPSRPVVDQAGNVYVASEEMIEEYDPSIPNKPICRAKFKPSGITSMTVNPATGELFVYGGRQAPRRVHQFTACEGGTFLETSEIAVAPERSAIYGMSFDPTRALSSGREPGVLYGGAPGTFPVNGKGQPGTSGLGYIFAQASEKPAVVSSVAATQVTEASATLNALIDPRGFATHYVFLYLSEAEFLEGGESFANAREAPVGGAVVPGAGGAQTASSSVAGLVPDTPYIFTVLAESNCAPSEPGKVCPVEGPPARFRTFASAEAGLPDGRVFEMVSPPEKSGGQAYPWDPGRGSCGSPPCKPGAAAARFPVQSTPNGNALVYEGEPFGTDGALIENEYLATRSGGGWDNTTLAPPQMSNRGNQLGYQVFDPLLGVGLISQQVPALTPGTPGEYANLYLQETGPGGSISPLISSAVVPHCDSGHLTGALKLNYLGASKDLSRVFFEANDALTPESSGTCGESNLYEWSAGSIRSVNVPTGTTLSNPGAVIGSGNLLEASNSGASAATAATAVSADGTRAFFTGTDGQLYVRVGSAVTLEVPGGIGCDAATPKAERICFLTSSSSGTSVLLSNGQIDTLNSAGTAYEPSVDLTAGLGGFEGIAGATGNFDHLYFVDTAVLTGTEENDQGDSAGLGAANLYSWTPGSVEFVAAVEPISSQTRLNGPVAVAPLARGAETSPDGRYLAFQTTSPVTGPENMGFCDHRTTSKVACREVFIYDSQTASIHCASCNPAGEVPVGGSSVLALGGLGNQGSGQQPRYVTDTGRLFFDSQDRLVPQDTNGIAEDVYEYEPQGIGSCAGNAPCVSLISGGRGTGDSNLLAIDESGDNVFFTTQDRLLKADRDERYDVYDARVGGGFVESAAAAPCQGEACQQVAPPVSLVRPSSSSIAGEPPTNAAKRTKCKAGQVKRGGRCTKKKKTQHKKKTHHKKQHKKTSKAANAKSKGGRR